MNRREFLAGSAGVSAGLFLTGGQANTMPNSVKIERVQTYRVIYPLVGRFKFFEDANGNPTGRQTVVVKITASDGTVGWGQSVPIAKWSYETLETVESTIKTYLTPHLIGKNPLDIDSLHKKMNAAIAPSFSTGQPICKAGIDLALFDLKGKLLKQTAAQMWGRQGIDEILLSWTLNPKTLEDIPALIEDGQKRGYHNFNVKVAPDLDFDIRLCKAVRQAVPEGFLWADANGGYDLETARKAVVALADYDVPVLEQPLPSNRITGYQELMKIKKLPIILDEGVVNSSDLVEFIKLGMLDGVAMKPARCGGLTDASRQIELLKKHRLMFLGSGLTDPDISLAATLLLYGAYGLKYPAALNGPQFLAGTSILKKPFEVKEGKLSVPKGYGLAVDVDEDALQEFHYKAGGNRL